LRRVVTEAKSRKRHRLTFLGPNSVFSQNESLVIKVFMVSAKRDHGA
jgi:hypothetical protein